LEQKNNDDENIWSLYMYSTQVGLKAGMQSIESTNEMDLMLRNMVRE
jgi:hypothetical protein